MYRYGSGLAADALDARVGRAVGGAGDPAMYRMMVRLAQAKDALHKHATVAGKATGAAAGKLANGGITHLKQAGDGLAHHAGKIHKRNPDLHLWGIAFLLCILYIGEGGAGSTCIQLTHCLKAAWFQPLT
jgi:hypothetical protein